MSLSKYLFKLLHQIYVLSSFLHEYIQEFLKFLVMITYVFFLHKSECIVLSDLSLSLNLFFVLALSGDDTLKLVLYLHYSNFICFFENFIHKCTKIYSHLPFFSTLIPLMSATVFSYHFFFFVYCSSFGNPL